MHSVFTSFDSVFSFWKAQKYSHYINMVQEFDQNKNKYSAPHLPRLHYYILHCKSGVLVDDVLG
jgi:hypothetical protein